MMNPGLTLENDRKGRPRGTLLAGADMGIHDRDYYRDQTRGSGWFSGTAPACKAIVLLNVGIFLFGKFLYDGNLLEDWFAGRSDAIFEHGQIWRLVTSAFLHDPENIWHLIINMLVFWWVGREMEAFYGTREFWWLYLSAAAVSCLCWAVMDYSREFHRTMVGASGAVMAVLAVYTFYNPRREVILYFIPVEMWLLLTLFVVSDGWSLLIRSKEPVAFAGHLGGVAYAYAFKTFDLRLKRLKGLLPKRGPKLRLVSPPDLPPPPREAPTTLRPSATTGPTRSPNAATATTRPVTTAVVSQESLDARLDEILVKIAGQGRESLTDEEKRILEEASRRARSRRGERI
jgi:membrane associated rhomboid family serine protease